MRYSSASYYGITKSLRASCALNDVVSIRVAKVASDASGTLSLRIKRLLLRLNIAFYLFADIFRQFKRVTERIG